LYKSRTNFATNIFPPFITNMLRGFFTNIPLLHPIFFSDRKGGQALPTCV